MWSAGQHSGVYVGIRLLVDRRDPFAADQCVFLIKVAADYSQPTKSGDSAQSLDERYRD